MTFRKMTGVVALAAAMLVAQAAGAQIWIGLMVGEMMARGQAAAAEDRCMTGTPMPDAEIAETRATSAAAMTGYWRAVQSGGAANVASVFQADRKSKWVSGSSSVGLAGLGAIKDPFAHSGATLAPDSLGYVRSGDGGSVRGQWAVRGADGKLVGTYDALFRRTGGDWRLSTLTLLPARSYVDPVVQYCHKPGDVMPYRLATTAQAQTYLEGRATKLRAKADKARVEADAAAAKASGAKASTQAVTTAADKKARAVDAETKAVAAMDVARKAAEGAALAKADAAAADRTKAEAIAALAS